MHLQFPHQKHLLNIRHPHRLHLSIIGRLLFLMFIVPNCLVNSSSSSVHAMADLSFSECLQMERLPADGIARAAKVLSVREGMPAYLHCPRQQNGSNLKAAWTRMRDSALLAVGGDTFTLDLRFQVSKGQQPNSHKTLADDWVLILRRAETEDQGCYLCEVNTEPINTLVPIYLKVRPTKAFGGEQKRREESWADLFAEDNGEKQRRTTRLEARLEGSTLVLNCTVERGREKGDGHGPTFWPTVVWTKDGAPLDLRNERKFGTDFRLSDSRDALIFSLRIKNVSPPKDNGLYACQGDRLIRSSEIVQLPANSAFHHWPQQMPSILMLILIFCYSQIIFCCHFPPFFVPFPE